MSDASRGARLRSTDRRPPREARGFDGSNASAVHRSGCSRAVVGILAPISRNKVCMDLPTPLAPAVTSTRFFESSRPTAPRRIAADWMRSLPGLSHEGAPTHLAAQLVGMLLESASADIGGPTPDFGVKGTRPQCSNHAQASENPRAVRFTCRRRSTTSVCSRAVRTCRAARSWCERVRAARARARGPGDNCALFSRSTWILLLREPSL